MGGTRYKKFINGRDKTQIQYIVNQYTDLRFFGLIKWPLLNHLDSIPSNISIGVAKGFTEVIWEKYQNEIKSNNKGKA